MPGLFNDMQAANGNCPDICKEGGPKGTGSCGAFSNDASGMWCPAQPGQANPVCCGSGDCCELDAGALAGTIIGKEERRGIGYP